jgi:hypothetical protein
MDSALRNGDSPVDPACEPGKRPPPLARYDAITDGVAFSLALAEDARGVWGPVTPLGMPLHHASTIEWEGHELLDAHRGTRVVVLATGRGRTALVHDPGRHTWFATYAARIDRVCSDRA